MADNQSTASGGIGLGGALFLVFLVLKLTHYIDWSWWWVTVPLWGPLLIMVLFLIVVGIIALIAASLKR